MIDPIEQSRAFLGKLMVKSLLPGLDSWKELLLWRIPVRTPPSGGQWGLDIRWIFVEMRRSRVRRGWADRFIMGILHAWECLRPGLGQPLPLGAEERLRQLLI